MKPSDLKENNSEMSKVDRSNVCQSSINHGLMERVKTRERICQFSGTGCLTLGKIFRFGKQMTNTMFQTITDKRLNLYKDEKQNTTKINTHNMCLRLNIQQFAQVKV